MRFLLFYLSGLIISTALSAQEVLIDEGSNWLYYDFGHEPFQQNTTKWYELFYSDVAWNSGDGQLGYGDGDENTVIGDTVLTAYFRKKINVADASIFESLRLELTYDDGAVIYLNGLEIARVNMPSGTIGYDTLAFNGSDNAKEFINFSNSLVSGDNLIAVEVHQRSAGSSDLSFDLKLISIPNLRVVRGPYLQSGSENSMTIKWRTSQPSISELKYGMDINLLHHSIKDPVSTTEHEIKVINLEPNSRYFYEINGSDGSLLERKQDLYFWTSPTIANRVPVQAWILGDCGTGNNNARAVRDAYYAYPGFSNRNLILFLGDNAYSSGTDVEYQTAIFENMYEDALKNTVSWSCLGNHDGISANSSTQSGPYYDIFTFPTMGESGGVPSGTEAYYSFNYANIHFISLDSYESDRSVGGSMFTWCESDLQNSTADWIVAFWHHPAYSKGSHDSDSESALIQMRENFLPLLENYGVDLVLSGHSHSYERSYFLNGHYGGSDSFNPIEETVGMSGHGDGRPEGNGAYVKALADPAGAVYITTGSAGQKSGGTLDHEAMFLSFNELGSCVLEIFGGILKVKFIRDTGLVQDSFVIEKDLGCVLNAPCDDGDICTVDDHLNSQCQCIGSAISIVPVNLVVGTENNPLNGTYKASQMIEVSGSVATEIGQLTTFIAPVVSLEPAFSVPVSSTFVIMQIGCGN